MTCFSRGGRRLSPGGSIVRRVRGECPHVASLRMEDLLKGILLANRSICGPISIVDKNRGAGLDFTLVVLGENGILVLSRPAGRLSVVAGRILRRTLTRCANAVVFMSRSECLVGGVTAEIMRMATSNMGRCRNGFSDCVRTGATRGTTITTATPLPGGSRNGGRCQAGRRHSRSTGHGGRRTSFRALVRTLRTRVTTLRRSVYGPRVTTSCRGVTRIYSRLRDGGGRLGRTVRG